MLSCAFESARGLASVRDARGHRNRDGYATFLVPFPNGRPCIGRIERNMTDQELLGRYLDPGVDHFFAGKSVRYSAPSPSYTQK